MKGNFSRRIVLGGLLSGAATMATSAPFTSPRPEVRPERDPNIIRPQARPSLADFVQEADLGGLVGIALMDVRSNALLESHLASIPLPPASVTKVFSSFFALEVLGPDFSFQTRLVASGEVVDGTLHGDLALVGGGDPTLQTDDLAEMAKALAASGIKEVKGAFNVWGGALPSIYEIDPNQLDHLGYNPAISGLNLNFNRVHFEWAQTGASYSINMDARSEQYRPAIEVARMAVVDRDLPIYTYANTGSRDEWSVARRALGKAGSRWLPVRFPALYAGEAFRSLAGGMGVKISAPTVVTDEPEGRDLVVHTSEPLVNVARDCLKFSTNITAEIMGLTASTRLLGQKPESLAVSARVMRDWIRAKTGARPTFVDHSGLGDRTRISAEDMVRFLSATGVYERMSPILKPVRVKDANGSPIDEPPARANAKTGTLNFVSALAGYVEKEGRPPIAFATFVADMPSRLASKSSQDEVPRGAASWNGRARQLQNDLLRRWSAR